MKVFVFASSLTSTYWNGAATYYRGIYKHLRRLGYEITFAEPDIYGRQQNRDAGEIDYAAVLVYQTPQDVERMLGQAAEADLIIKHSGVGADDAWLEAGVLACRRQGAKAIFWDVDAPATLARIEKDRADPFRRLIPQYDAIFTYGGGTPVVERYLGWGARHCTPIYNALDPESHHPVRPDPSFACDLAFVGHRLPDRERRVEQFFFAAAELAPELRFMLGGEGWGGRSMPGNVRWIGHVGAGEHNRVNCSARMVLNINRESMADVGFSPPTRVFEVSGAGACLISDAWPGIEQFFAPETEILVARSGEQVAAFLRDTPPGRARAMGDAMRRRALRDHTYVLRAQQVDRELERTGIKPARRAGEEGNPGIEEALASSAPSQSGFR